MVKQLNIHYTDARRFLVFLFLYCNFSLLTGQDRIHVLVNGSAGGIVDGNLSSYLIGPGNDQKYICLDAGTLINGFSKLNQSGHLPSAIPNKSDLVPEWNMLRNGISCYLISHAHYDHIMGLIAASPDDTPKPIFASQQTLNDLTEFVFNNRIWANFTNKGVSPSLGKYQLLSLPDLTPVTILNSGFQVTAYPLCHGGTVSSAFLIKNHLGAVLYLGDTGADTIERCTNLASLWAQIAPLIRSKELKAIMMECSYPNERATEKLYGHLTPVLVFQELSKLAKLVKPQEFTTALEGITLLITHIKPDGVTPSNDKQMKAQEAASGSSYSEHTTSDYLTALSKELVLSQLTALNNLNLKLLIANQGDCYSF